LLKAYGQNSERGEMALSDPEPGEGSLSRGAIFLLDDSNRFGGGQVVTSNPTILVLEVMYNLSES
jgi:hypothetical protein